MSLFLAFIGVSIIGTWGLASLGLVVGGCFLLADPAAQPTASGATLPGIVLLVAGLVSFGIMFVVTSPLLGIDPPLPIKAKNIIPASRLTRWAKVGAIREFPDGYPKEVRVLSKRILIVRMGERAYALNALCSHARLPFGGFPGSPIKSLPVRDDCIMCPFHGARFAVETGRVVRQPFDSAWNLEHPFLGGFQEKIFKVLSKFPAPPGAPKPSMRAETIQTYPVRVESGEILVALPDK